MAIVTDSTADLPPALSEPLGIRVVPLNVHFGEQVFRDQVDLSTPEFMERLTSSAVLPKTSQPSPGAFAAVYEALAKDHDGIVSIHISGKLSGTVNAARAARDSLPEPSRVVVLDSETVTAPL
ncbi:MAG: DegV family protein, partial [Chloroflexota bacterium]